MLSISNPLSAAQVRTYHKKEFAAREQNYWSRGAEVFSEWRGNLTKTYGLSGPVDEDAFARLSNGQHPQTGEQLVRQQAHREYVDEHGKRVKSKPRAGWDATISAPKSVSIAALVGGDERVRQAHRESVRVALTELERYTDARIGNVHLPQRTGTFVAATFEHDTARPVNGYAAPQLHTHAIIFNQTFPEQRKGRASAIESKEMFNSQEYVTAVYRSELAIRLKGLGYEVMRGRSGEPVIVGFSDEYLKAASPRRDQILEHLKAHGVSGPEAAHIAAISTRDGKQILTPEEIRDRHRQLAASFGDRPEQIVAEARLRSLNRGTRTYGQKDRLKQAQAAITYARDHRFERSSVCHERDILSAAMARAMGSVDSRDIQAAFDRGVAGGDFQRVDGRKERWTTAALLKLEKQNIELLTAGKERHCELVSAPSRDEALNQNPHLSPAQRKAALEVLTNRDQVIGFEGRAGTGKTTTLSVIRAAAEMDGIKVIGFAPTSRAAKKLAEAGMETMTLQRYLQRQSPAGTAEQRLHIIDESSLASTRQISAFLVGLNEHERVVLVGDSRQHQAVEAGRPFQQLQEAGMQTAHLIEIIRQKDPALKSVVEKLSQGEVNLAVQELDRQGRIHEIHGDEERIAAVVREYMRAPDSTLIVSPDNRSRTAINNQIHRELQAAGYVSNHDQSVSVLVQRQNMTGADRTWAAKYEVGDVVYYSRSSAKTGISRGDYTRVEAIDKDENLLTVAKSDGQKVTYDPSRQSGVSIYREEERMLAVGDCIQFTAPNRALSVANRELATVASLDSKTMRLDVEDGRAITVDLHEWRHIDHGYAMTSHSSQGQTAGRVLIYAETATVHPDLLNTRMAYVGISRGQLDAQIFTDNKQDIAAALNRDVSQESAHLGVLPTEHLALDPGQGWETDMAEEIAMGLGK